MKSLKLYLEELFATPMNTIGMGDTAAPTETNIGSGDVQIPKCIDIVTGKMYKRRKRFRRYKI